MTLPKTYKTIRWADDMDPGGVDTDSDLESLEQDGLHIISQDLGSNADDQSKGVGAMNYLGGTSAELAKMPGIIDAQLHDDPRMSTSSTTLVAQPDGSSRVQVAIVVAGEVVNLEYQLGPDGLTVV